MIEFLDKLVSGDVSNLVLGHQECVFVVPEGMYEEDAELVNHLDHPEDERLVLTVALLEVCKHGRGGDV